MENTSSTNFNPTFSGFLQFLTPITPLVAFIAAMANIANNLSNTEGAYINTFMMIALLFLLLLLAGYVYSINKEINSEYIENIVQIVRLRKNIKMLAQILVLLILGGLILGVLTSQILVHTFEITSPTDYSPVDQTIAVMGHGAVPGNEISITVIDDLGQLWQAGVTYSDPNGDWEMKPVYVGNPGDEQNGKSYSIYAMMEYNGGKIQTKTIHITRK